MLALLLLLVLCEDGVAAPADERLLHRPKPCPPTEARTLFGLTFLLGDLVVHQQRPCPDAWSPAHQPHKPHRPHRPHKPHRPLFSGSRPPAAQDHLPDDHKPVFEEVAEDEVEEDEYRPGPLVGAPSLQVDGFAQGLQNLRPTRLLHTLSNYLVDPFVQLFYRR